MSRKRFHEICAKLVSGLADDVERREALNYLKDHPEALDDAALELGIETMLYRVFGRDAKILGTPANLKGEEMKAQSEKETIATTVNDRRLIEDYIPVVPISVECAREKSIHPKPTATLHWYWARIPLVSARAAIYGTMLHAPKSSQERAGTSKAIRDLCTHPPSPSAIEAARKRILQAHKDRLVKAGDLSEDTPLEKVPPPRILDLFAGASAIPFEAQRLGAEAYALDLNPVAHLIELCTLVYPQTFGPSLTTDVEKWCRWLLRETYTRVGRLYPPIPIKGKVDSKEDPQSRMFEEETPDDSEGEDDADVGEDQEAASIGQPPPGHYRPVAYLWTRTVLCPNDQCVDKDGQRRPVPLARQTWLVKKVKGRKRFVALLPVPDGQRGIVHYRVVEGSTPEALGFDPSGTYVRGGQTVCPFCTAPIADDYIKREGVAKRMSASLMTVVCARPGVKGRTYLTADAIERAMPDDVAVDQYIQKIIADLEPMGQLDEPIKAPIETGFRVQNYGFTKFEELFTRRQLATLLTMAVLVRKANARMLKEGMDVDRARAVCAYLGILVDRQVDYSSTICTWHTTGEKIGHTFANNALPMKWDYAEMNPFGAASGSASGAIRLIVESIRSAVDNGRPAHVHRGSALRLPFEDGSMDAVVTDPPYYDNIFYGDLSDFFYPWLKRSVGFLFPEHFVEDPESLTPKGEECVAKAYNFDGKDRKKKAYHAYEAMMRQAFLECRRVLRPGGPLVVVYAHKTTSGWSSLLEALQRSGFVVTEAWPLATAMKGKVLGLNKAMLANAIFLVCRRRETDDEASYNEIVKPEMQTIVRKRTEDLFKEGLAGNNLLIAGIGAGLQAYSRHKRVVLGSGEDVSPARFLADVQQEVVQAILAKMNTLAPAGVGKLDSRSRFYVLVKNEFGMGSVESGHMTLLAQGSLGAEENIQDMESGRNPLLDNKKGFYCLRDYKARGEDDKLGLPVEGQYPPLIDVAHRLLWLFENSKGLITEFLVQARPNPTQLKLLAQCLSPSALEPSESVSKNDVTFEERQAEILLSVWDQYVKPGVFGR